MDSISIRLISFQHCPHEGNKVAQNLARLSFDSGHNFLWDGDPPPSVLNDVINNVSVFEV
jgi:hypothetical protein